MLSIGGTALSVMAFLACAILIWAIAFLTGLLTGFLFVGAWILAILTVAAMLLQQRFHATIAANNQATWTAGLQAATVSIPLFILFVDAPLARALAHITQADRMAFHMIGNLGDSAYYLYPLGIIGLGLVALVFWDRAQAMRPIINHVLPYIGFAFSAVALSGIAAIILKILIGRARPRILLSEDWYGLDPLGLGSSFQSFPSGHATTAFTVAFVVAFLWPRLLYPAMAMGVTIALCRVAVNAHYLSDVIAGGILAAVVTCLLRAEFATRGVIFHSVTNPQPRNAYPTA
jgi:membrane-associated phospholipid phosphatase